MNSLHHIIWLKFFFSYFARVEVMACLPENDFLELLLLLLKHSSTEIVNFPEIVKKAMWSYEFWIMFVDFVEHYQYHMSLISYWRSPLANYFLLSLFNVQTLSKYRSRSYLRMSRKLLMHDDLCRIYNFRILDNC